MKFTIQSFVFGFYFPAEFVFDSVLDVWPNVVPCNKNKLNGTYVYRHKHNYIPYSTFTLLR